MNLKCLLAMPLCAAALAACDRSNPPAAKLERAAEELVSDLDGEALPRQAKGPYAPHDECTDQPGAGEFLANLRKAVAARDTNALVALAAEDIRLDFGGGAGVATLRSRLELAAEDDEPAARSPGLWDELDTLLDMGCAADGAVLIMPWYFAQEIEVETGRGFIVTGEDVPLYTSISKESPVLDRISWDVVELVDDIRSTPEMRHVAWTDAEGDTIDGFVAGEMLRSTIDYRLLANRRNNRWRITALIGGD